MAGTDPNKFLTVTELNQALNQMLEEEFPSVDFEGEISQITRAASGHIYFTVKDEQSQISAVMWRSTASQLTFKPDVGTAVRCSGRPNLYHKSGRLQIIVRAMLPAGEGDLRKRFLMLKEKLEKEGLFAVERKRELPYFPDVVGVVTSKTGAVIHDIMVKIRERMPSTTVHLVDARVQGEGAAEEIAAGIEILNRLGEVDVIIVGRGGGSLEDLWPFNEEIVARAVFASRIPVVSGVGHEVDESLSDLVADVRAPTPTAAAELVVPKRTDLLEQVSEYERRLLDFDRWFQPLVQSFEELELRLTQRVRQVLQEAALRFESAKSKLRTIHPDKILASLKATLDLFQEKLLGSAAKDLTLAALKLDAYEKALHQAFVPAKLQVKAEQVSVLENRLSKAISSFLRESSQSLEGVSARLEALSHKKVLERGYSIVEKDGCIVKNAGDLKKEDTLKVSFAQGAVAAEVLNITIDNNAG